MRTSGLALLLLSLAPLAPAAAQPASTPPASQAAEATPDPARLSAAQRLAPLVMPAEQIQRMFTGGMPIMDVAMDMTAADIGLGAEAGLSEADRQRPLGELAAQADPHFRERMAIRNRIMSEAMGEIMLAAMPDLHRVVAEIYARRFNLEELEAAIAYYSTPAGRRFIEVSLTLMQDPAFVRGMAALTPRLVAAFASMEERVRAASAHLPEPSPPADDAADAAED